MRQVYVTVVLYLQRKCHNTVILHLDRYCYLFTTRDVQDPRSGSGSGRIIGFFILSESGRILSSGSGIRQLHKNQDLGHLYFLRSLGFSVSLSQLQSLHGVKALWKRPLQAVWQ